MPTSILEQIAQNLLATCEGITTVNGYENTCTASRRLQHGDAPVDRKIVIWQDNPSKVANPPQAHVAWQQPFWFIGHIRESESSSTSVDERVNSIRSDIERALRIDPTRGGLAVDTTIGDPVLIEDDAGSTVGVAVYAVVHYRTLIDDPYSQ